MEFQKSDMERYLHFFPGDYILYTLKDAQLEIVAFSEQIHQLFGMTKEEYIQALKKPVLSGTLSMDDSYLLQALQDTVDCRKTEDLYIRIIHKTKTYVWMHVKAKMIGYYQENPLVVVEYFHIEGEQKAFHQVLNNSDFMVYICDWKTKELLYANPDALHYWEKAEYAEYPCYHLAEQFKPCLNCSSCHLQSDSVHVAEHYDKNLKRWYHVECQKTILYGREAVMHFVKDITEQRERKIQLQQDKQLAYRINRMMFEFIALISVKDHIVQFKNVKEDLDTTAMTITSNYDEEYLAAIDRLVIPEEREYCRKCASIDHLVAQLSQQDIYSYTWTQPSSQNKTFRKKMEYFWLDETHENIVAVKLDITEVYNKQQLQLSKLQRATVEAEKANSAKSSFLSRISHDMRTPLNGILGMSRLMREETDLKKIHQDLDLLSLSSNYLLHLINDTLDVSKIESGKMVLNPVICDGKSVFENTLALLRPNLQEKNITLHIHADQLPFTTLYLDVGRVEQLIINLLGNSIKFTPYGGTIDFYMKNISCENDILTDEIIIKDNGIGISSEFLPHIFEPFSQEHNSVTSQYKGTGLGMTISKQLVELMGGKIKIESEVGKGTQISFTLNLPKATEQQIEEYHQQKMVSAYQYLNGKKILVCEDHPLNRKIVVQLLQKVNCEIFCAQNGQEGVEKFQKDPDKYDAILMDIRMPIMDGMTATKIIRALPMAHAKLIPIIAMTANAYDEDIQKYLHIGMNAHLSKPIEPEKMYDVILENILKK